MIERSPDWPSLLDSICFRAISRRAEPGEVCLLRRPPHATHSDGDLKSTGREIWRITVGLKVVAAPCYSTVPSAHGPHAGAR